MALTPRLVAVSLLLLSACTHGVPRRATAPTTTTTAASAGGVATVTGKAHISGRLTTLSAPATLTDPIATPFTITVAEAGHGGFEIAHAMVDGHDDSIVWSGGRPLPVTGNCRLDVAEAPLELTASGAAFALDGAVRALTAGDCAFGSSVAVGRSGVAEPRDSVRFQLPQDAPFQPTGNASVRIDPTRHYEGHHGSATATGSFTVDTARGDTWKATKITLGDGTWIADVTATPEGLRVDAQFDGDLTMQLA